MGDGGIAKWQTGFSKLVKFLRDNYSYNKGEMYVATWGSGNILDVSTTYHQAHYLKFLRAFIEAVLRYTGS